MIRGFKDKVAEALFAGKKVRALPPSILRPAYRKLIALDNARSLMDLRSPPGNRLEALSGDRRGQHSIRINDQFRICFVWRDDGVHDVEIADYH
jgi:proteic killer suppression protein